MTREIEWVEFTWEDKTLIAIGHDPHRLDDTLWVRIKFEKNNVKAEAEIPLSAYAVRTYLNRWFPFNAPRQEPAPSPETATPVDPGK